MKFLLLLFGFTLAFSPLHAEVYLLAPGKSGVALDQSQYMQISHLLEFTPLYREKMELNGVPLEMTVGNARDSYTDILNALLQLRLDNLQLDGDTILLDLAQSARTNRKYLLVNTGDRLPAVIFSVDMPKELPTLKQWPSELPLPAGAVPEKIIFYPDRHATYGTFSNVTDPQTAFRDLTSHLLARNWQSAGNEHRYQDGQSGLFFRFNPNSALWITLDSLGRGAIYRKDSLQ